MKCVVCMVGLFRARVPILALMGWIAATRGVEAQILFTENFESSSVFPLGNGYSRSTLAGVPGAHNTSPPLPINADGDFELFFQRPPIVPGHVITLAPGNYANVRIEGIVGLGYVDAASANAGFILRATGPGDYYISDVGLTSGAFRISRAIGGIIQGSSSVMAIPDFDPINENYRIIFEATGSNLFASLSLLRVVNGAVTESLIGTLSRMETALPTGQVGLMAFSAFGNSAFFDDITVSVVPEPNVWPLGILGLAALARPPRRSARRNAITAR